MWESSGGVSGNQVLGFDGFFISYMPPLGMSGFRLMASNNHGAETALCVEDCNRTNYFILNGDFRKQYEEIGPQGLEACMKFYRDNIGQSSSWSNDDTASATTT